LAKAFEPSNLAAPVARPEGGDAGLLERINGPDDQGGLGADDDQADVVGPRSGDDCVDVPGADLVEAGRIGGDPGVAGSAEQLWGLRRAPQRADDRVLATASADYEYPQADRLT